MLPLSLDGSPAVRSQLLKTLRALRPEELQGHAEAILLYVRAGLTNMAVGIRETALDLLALTLDAIPLEVVSSAGGWIKTLHYFASFFGWPVDNGKGQSTAPKTQSASGAKVVVKGLGVLAMYLAAGLVAHEDTTDTIGNLNLMFPIVDMNLHRLPRFANPFVHLGLFRTQQSDDNEALADRAERQGAFGRSLFGAFDAQLSKMKKEGGELGRMATQAQTAMTEGMADFENIQ